MLWAADDVSEVSLILAFENLRGVLFLGSGKREREAREDICLF